MHQIRFPHLRGGRGKGSVAEGEGKGKGRGGRGSEGGRKGLVKSVKPRARKVASPPKLLTIRLLTIRQTACLKTEA